MRINTIAGLSLLLISGLSMAEEAQDRSNRAIFFEDVDASNFIRLGAPHDLDADFSLILPHDAGVLGQVLTTDGAGNLSWTTIPTFTQPGEASQTEFGQVKGGRVPGSNGAAPSGSGFIGEIVQQPTLVQGNPNPPAPVPVTNSNSPVAVRTINLSPGVWLIHGTVELNPKETNVSRFRVVISATGDTAIVNPPGSSGTSTALSFGNVADVKFNNNQINATGGYFLNVMRIIRVDANSEINLNAQITFSGTSNAAFSRESILQAVRVG